MNHGMCVCTGLAAQAVLAAPWAYTVSICGHLLCVSGGVWGVATGGCGWLCKEVQPAVTITCWLQVVQDCQLLPLWL